MIDDLLGKATRFPFTNTVAGAARRSDQRRVDVSTPGLE